MSWKARARAKLHAVRHAVKRLGHRPRTRQELHQYWSAPPDAGNKPESYLQKSENAKSEFLVSLVQRYVAPNASIMEIGCNAGRNLNFLFRAGFENLQAIEISERAIATFREAFPEVACHVSIRNYPVEQAIPGYEDNSVDLIFTMAVLEHIHNESSGVFSDMVRVARRWIITIEDEMDVSDRHFPRNYRRVFEGLGMKQIEEMADMDQYGLPTGFITRVFEKQEGRVT